MASTRQTYWFHYTDDEGVRSHLSLAEFEGLVEGRRLDGRGWRGVFCGLHVGSVVVHDDF